MGNSFIIVMGHIRMNLTFSLLINRAKKNITCFQEHNIKKKTD